MSLPSVLLIPEILTGFLSPRSNQSLTKLEDPAPECDESGKRAVYSPPQLGNAWGSHFWLPLSSWNPGSHHASLLFKMEKGDIWKVEKGQRV